MNFAVMADLIMKDLCTVAWTQEIQKKSVISSQIRYLLYFVPIMNIDNRRGNLKSVPKKFGLLVLSI